MAEMEIGWLKGIKAEKKTLPREKQIRKRTDPEESTESNESSGEKEKDSREEIKKWKH